MRLSVGLVTLLVAGSVTASQFRFERSVTPGAAGANRLDVDAALLAGAASDLHDVRLFDAKGREVPYLLVPPAGTAARWTPARLLPVAPTKATSGFEADLGTVQEIDRLRIDGVTPPFMKHVTVEGSGDRARWNLLADTTLFDLPDQSLESHDAAFIAGSYRYLRVTWDDRTSARARGALTVSARIHDSAAAPEPLRAALSYRQGSDPRASRYRIALPAANLPITSLEVQVGDGDVFRRAVVSQPELRGAEIVQSEIGHSTLRRAVRDGLVASDLTIPIAPPSGRELLLTIDAASQPPLEVTGIIAVYAPQPWIYFEVPDAASLTVRYGDSSLKTARYDLEAARRFVGGARPAIAQWTTTPATATFDPSRVQASVPLRGPKIDRAAFRFVRFVPATAPGLVIIPLDAHVLAHTHGRTADVRVIDSHSRQIPYVAERRPDPLSLTLPIPRRVEGKGTSTYRFKMPYDTLRGEVWLTLTTNAGIFERHVSAIAAADDRRGREPVEISAATWRNSDSDVAPAALMLGPVPFGTTAVDVLVDEGDNTPLPITSARLLLPNWAIRLQDPGEPLWVIYGSRTAEAPRYDLALIAPQLFSQPARELQLARVNGTPDEADAVQRKYFWMVIIVAVVVLGALLARLLTMFGGEEPRSLGDVPGRGDPPG